jgi:dTDP-glucose 4,6-dehydratase
LSKILVTGGAGFIGSAFIRAAFARPGFSGSIVNLDALTYAGNLENLTDVERDPRYRFVRADVADRPAVEQVFAEQRIDAVVHFAAESHVDRSVLDASAFIRTNVVGTQVLLDVARARKVDRFVHVSTDEVYGEISSGSSTESDALAPRNPYSASKAGGEMMVGAYVSTYGLPALITRGSNTYGPYQYPEKLIPLAVTNVLDGVPIPIYGDGRQVRDWIHARDHAAGIELLLRRGEPGQAYNVGGGNERENLAIARIILDELDAPNEMLTHVTDRQGHDRRYALDTSRIRALGWRPEIDFEQGLRETIQWYRDNRGWWEPIKSGEFAGYYRSNYAAREQIG